MLKVMDAAELGHKLMVFPLLQAASEKLPLAKDDPMESLGSKPAIPSPGDRFLPEGPHQGGTT